LEPDSSPREPGETPKNKTDDSPQLPKSPQIPLKLKNPSPNNTKEPELLKVIGRLKGELAEKDKQLKAKDNNISLLTSENEKLRTINQEKDQKLKELQEKLKQLTTKTKSLIETAKIKQKQEPEFIPKNNNFLIKKPPNNSLNVEAKPKTELLAQVQV
jgi:predicted RNase H-like nuclease (RuvC/YqgF family)